MASDSCQWIPDNQPFLEKNPRAQAFLRQFTISSELNVHEEACTEWLEGLKKVLVQEELAQNNTTNGISLSRTLYKCSIEDKKSISQTFHHVLAQIELAKVLDA